MQSKQYIQNFGGSQKQLTKKRAAKVFSGKLQKLYKKISVIKIFFDNIVSHLNSNSDIKDFVKGIFL